MRNPLPTNGFFDIPSSFPGRVSAIAGAAILTVWMLFGVGISAGLDGQSTVGKLVYGTLTIFMVLASIVAVGVGVFAVIRDHVRSFVTLFSILLGALLGWFLVIELFVGHE